MEARIASLHSLRSLCGALITAVSEAPSSAWHVTRSYLLL